MGVQQTLSLASAPRCQKVAPQPLWVHCLSDGPAGRRGLSHPNLPAPPHGPLGTHPPTIWSFCAGDKAGKFTGLVTGAEGGTFWGLCFLVEEEARLSLRVGEGMLLS